MGLKLSYQNWIDDPATVITPSQETTQMPATSVAQTLSYLIWRALIPSSPTVTIDFDFGQARPIQAVGVQFMRSVTPDQYGQTPGYSATDTIRVELTNASTTTGGVTTANWSGTHVYDSGALNSGVLANFGTYGLWLGSSYSARFMRVTFVATSRLTAGWLDVKRIWAGPVIAPRIGFSYGINHTWESASKLLTPQRGTTIFPAYIEAKRKWSFVLGWVDNATERDLLEDFESYMTTAGEFFIHRDDLTTGRGDMFAYQTQVSGLVNDNFGKSSKSFLISENI